MKAKRLKELLANVDDNDEVFIRNSVNPAGNIQEVAQLEKSTYSSFGDDIDCVILNTDSSKIIETQNDNPVDYLGDN